MKNKMGKLVFSKHAYSGKNTTVKTKTAQQATWLQAVA